jgi:hypothetical protein
VQTEFLEREDAVQKRSEVLRWRWVKVHTTMRPITLKPYQLIQEVGKWTRIGNHSGFLEECFDLYEITQITGIEYQTSLLK